MNKKFKMYCKDYGFQKDDLTFFRNVFGKNIKQTSIDVDLVAKKNEYTSILLLRTAINNPVLKFIRNNYKIVDKYDTVICDIPADEISECVYRKQSEAIAEYQMLLKSGINYTFLIKF